MKDNRMRRLIPFLIVLNSAFTSLPAAEVDSKVDSAIDSTPYDHLTAGARTDLESALQELSDLQANISEERVPLSKELNATEQKVIERRKDFERLQRSAENQLVDLNVLKSEVKRRQDEIKFLESLLNEYAKAFETRIHISEAPVYDGLIQEAKLVTGNPDLTPAEKLTTQAGLLRTALERLENLSGGHTFAGRGLTPKGTVEQGRFGLVGPVSVFASNDGSAAGVAELQLGSPEATIITVDPKFTPEILSIVKSGEGMLPVDATMGNALKISATKDTIWGHIKKGGPVMVPILGLGLTALIIALMKWFEISRIRVVGPIELQAILTHLNSGHRGKALSFAQSITGPVGEMLATAVRHADEKKEYIEEVMYEKMLTTKPKLERLMPMIALTAATAPLLGLLGTVTGMINTFNMITVFGTGDPKTLAGGISEALVTTEFGLIVAVPSLLLHAFISRQAKGVLGSMEQTTVGFINGVNGPASSELDEKEESAIQSTLKDERNEYAGNVYP